MTILNRFGTQSLSINITDDIQGGTAGVMGDFNSRGLNVTILAENGEKLEDPEVNIKLLCRTEDGAQLIFTKGEYLDNGIYNVPFPNEIFEKEQELDCIIQLTIEEEIIYSRIFKRKVAKGLLGTEREGTSTIIDLLKIMDFADHYEEKLKEMEELGNKEEAEIIAKALDLTEDFNNNSTEKTNTFNNNTQDKTNKFNSNAKKKTDTFNANAVEKTNAFNNNAKEKTDIVENLKNETEAAMDSTLYARDHVENLKNETEATISIFNQDYNNFNESYTEIEGILDAENERVEAENERKKHDDEIQEIINNGLESQLGDYAKLTDLEPLKAGDFPLTVINASYQEEQQLLKVFVKESSNSIHYHDNLLANHETRIGKLETDFEELELTDEKILITKYNNSLAFWINIAEGMIKENKRLVEKTQEIVTRQGNRITALEQELQGQNEQMARTLESLKRWTLGGVE